MNKLTINYLERMLKKEIFYMNIKELEEFSSEIFEEIKSIRLYEDPKEFLPKLENKLKEVELKKIKLENIDEITRYEYKKDKLQEEIEELEKKKQNEERYKKVKILEDLKADKRRVIPRNRVSEEQRKILLEDGFTQTNELCMYEKKRIPVLIKPRLNHSKTHEFLVWSAKRLLRRTPEITIIKEHLTRDADITFEFKGKTFALEIETGNLLRKPEQLKEKIDYLNKKYPNRWMIIVSNRDYLTSYKKFGLASSRIEARANLAKLLKNAHT